MNFSNTLNYIKDNFPNTLNNMKDEFFKCTKQYEK